MNTPGIVFGMNSIFAVHHFLPEILSLVREMRMDVTVIAPSHAGKDPELGCAGIRYCAVPMKRVPA